jgi:hypothetical protein
MIALVVNLRGKRKCCHLRCVSGKFDATETNETLNASIDVNVNFAATFEKSEQCFIAELKSDEVGRVCAVDVLIDRTLKDVIVDL